MRELPLAVKWMEGAWDAVWFCPDDGNMSFQMVRPNLC